MGQLKVKIATTSEVKEKIAHIWKVFARHVGFEYELVNEGQDLLLSDQADADIAISNKFTENIIAEKYAHKHYYDSEPLIYNADGKPDYLGTCFYMLNCLQEYGDEPEDKTGRFRYEDSYQKKFNCVEENLVGKYFDNLLESVPILNASYKKPSVPSKYFLSHDNDVLHGSFTQDGLYALKRGRFDIILKLIFNEILQKPEWRNMSRIMDIEDEYDIKSTFFWLVNQGKYNGVNNADYSISDDTIRKLHAEIDSRGWVNGLHKSTSDESYADELKKLSTPVTANRNHFLKIDIPTSFEELESAGLRLDCSVGFAEKIGFRTGYALPFQPFNMRSDKEFNFLEISLHVMDATLYNYEKISPSEGKEKVMNFLEAHKENAVMSILWHNKYFTPYKYKGYLDIYKSMLDFIIQNKMSSVTPKELVKEYIESDK